MQNVFRNFVILCCVLLAPQMAFADTSAVTFTSYQGSISLDANIGWSFEVTKTLTVTGLGYYDIGFDGLASDHTVGIFDFTGALLGWNVVAGGTAAPIMDGFRYVALAPVVLNPGIYVVMANNPSTDAFVALATNFVADPRIIFGTGVYSFGGASLQPPAFADVQFNPSFFGPNLLVAEDTGTTVPEATSLLLLGTGLLAIAGTRSLRKSR